MKKTQLFGWLILIAIWSAGCCGMKMAPKDGTSAHFESVSKHLTLGGEVYAYVDIDGDINKGAQMINDVLQSVKDELPEDFIEKVDAVKLAQKLGLSQVSAIGVSSYKKGSHYSNSAFIKISGGREGVMKMYGGAAHPFEVIDMAPQDVGIVFEQDINLKILFDLFFESLSEVAGEGPEAKELMDELTEPIEGMSFTAMDVIERLDTKVIGVIQIHEDKQIQIPDEELSIPYTELMLGIDNMGLVFDSIIKMLGPSPLVIHKKGDGFETLESAQPLPGDLSVYAPVLRKETASGRLYIATSKEYLNKCLGKSSALRQNAVFNKAVVGLPIEAGNGFAYVSPGFINSIRNVINKVFEQDDETRFAATLLSKWIPDSSEGQASVTVNMDDGIYFGSNTYDSHKSTLLTAAYLNPVVLGALAATAIPEFDKYQDKAKREEAVTHLEQCYVGVLAYYEDHKALPESVDWTPALPPSDSPYFSVPSTWDHPTWQGIGFSMKESHYYQYSYIKEDNRFTCLARGDIDGDGEFSLFERSAMISQDGSVQDDFGFKESNPLE